ncbi:hypothetical protein DYBT9275_00553 [Dyadobacter sp. CECT 9275]|uniref:Uncharacterized protein n=1 Tax=Dyadobacter helix TaxID=2822344 RepID=A0A916J8P5_9BACT|nr:hypothetical protein [Dyadobacter sp. CECT 9275]CAG4990540.1 hypothetical protein DYBT9275_00553 [Dyadobacter sp. CECT 9275]
MMKTSIIISLLLLICFHEVAAQDETVLLSKMKINFAVPDLPAQKLLGSGDSKLLRPSTVEALSVILPQFVQSGSLTIPQSFSAEIAPFILVKQNKAIHLSDYIKNRTINSLRISIATGQDSTDKKLNARKLGVGFRISLLDKGDLKTDNGSLLALAKQLQGHILNEIDVRNRFMKENHMNIVTFDEKMNNDTTFVKTFEQYYNDKFMEIPEAHRINVTGAILGKADTKSIAELIEDYKKDNWNSAKVDMAVAFTAVSSDSLIRNLKKDNFSAWLSGAHPISKWGQVLWSANYEHASVVNEDLKREQSNGITLSSRIFAGNNEAKGFLEAQYSTNSFRKENVWFSYLGGEIYLISGIWLNLYAGIKKSSLLSKAELVSSFDFRFTLPGK